MSLPPRVRENLARDIHQILGITTIRDVNVPNLTLTQRRIQEWQVLHLPTTGERGGSSSPVEVRERAEDRQVARQASRDHDTLDGLIDAWRAELTLARYTGLSRELAQASQRLAEVVARYTHPVDHSLLPTTTPAECISCARPGKVGRREYQGHKGIPVYEKAKAHGLCRWCYDVTRAEKRWPPIDIVDIYHRVGPRAAGLELAKRARKQA